MSTKTMKERPAIFVPSSRLHHIFWLQIPCKGSNGTLDRLSPQEITEGILGTRLAGAQLYVIDQFYKSFSSEA